MGRNQSFGMKPRIYDLACKLYESVGTGTFTIVDAAQAVNEPNLSALGGRMFAMRNEGAMKITNVVYGSSGKRRIRYYQFTPRWVAFKANEPIREAKAERRRVLAAARAQQVGVCNGR